MIDVKIKRLTNTAIIPKKAHADDAAFDLYADIKNKVILFGETEPIKGMKIYPHETVKIGTGIAMAIPEWYWGAIYARSGLATKNGLRPSNCVGVVDSGYRGEIIVALHNDSNEVQIIKHGDRIAQFMLCPVFDTNLIEVNELDETDRGNGGFGSTEKNNTDPNQLSLF